MSHSIEQAIKHGVNHHHWNKQGEHSRGHTSMLLQQSLASLKCSFYKHVIAQTQTREHNGKVWQSFGVGANGKYERKPYTRFHVDVGLHYTYIFRCTH